MLVFFSMLPIHINNRNCSIVIIHKPNCWLAISGKSSIPCTRFKPIYLIANLLKFNTMTIFNKFLLKIFITNLFWFKVNIKDECKQFTSIGKIRSGPGYILSTNMSPRSRGVFCCSLLREHKLPRKQSLNWCLGTLSRVKVLNGASGGLFS